MSRLHTGLRRPAGGLQSLLAVEGLTVGVVLVALVVGVSVASSQFRSGENIENVLVQSVFLMLVAIGLTFVLVTGGIDLSVGSVMGLAAGVTGLLLVHDVNWVLACLGGLATGALIGLVNAIIITRLGVSDFMVTLATLVSLRGILQLFDTGTRFSSLPSNDFAYLTQGKPAGIPMAVLIAAGVVIIATFVLRGTAFGRQVFAVGMNRRAAHLSGINVLGVRLKVYMLSATMAAAGGIMLASRLSSVGVDHGKGYELSAIAAAVVGGTALAGGRGTIPGTVVGALLFAVLDNSLIILGVNTFYYEIITGIIVIGAVALERVFQRVALQRGPALSEAPREPGLHDALLGTGPVSIGERGSQ